MSIYTFNRDDSQRIANVVPKAEHFFSRGQTVHSMPQYDNSEVWYAQLTEKDPDGQNGYWKWREGFYDAGEWRNLTGGREGDNDEYRYVRHISWDDAEIGQIVQIKEVLNRDTGLTELVFTDEVTNPEGLIFYADDTGGVGQARNDSLWTTKVGAKVLTNVGEAEIQKGFQIASGQSAQVTITFVDLGDGYELVNAQMTQGQGQYWNESDGVIIVNWRIAEVETLGDMGRLKQYHSGDIHLEIFAFGGDDEDDDDPYNPTPGNNTKPMKVEGDNKWIQVVKNGRCFTVEHINQNPIDVWKTLNLNKTGGGTYVVEIDKRGHVISVDEDGGGAEYTPTTDYDVLSSTLTSAAVGSDIRPELVGGDGITMDYKVLSGGNNYLDFVNTRQAMATIKNDNGDTINFDVFDIAQAGFPAFNQELMENNGGTSGRNESHLYLSTERFRFNGTVTLAVSVIGKGLTASQTLSTASCTASHSINTSIIRNYNDPNAFETTLTVSYDLANLDAGYYTQLSVETADGDPVGFSLTGQNGPFIEGTQDLTLDSSSATTEQKIWFSFDDLPNIASGDAIKICSKLLSSEGDYNANVEECTVVGYQSESMCVLDENGDIVLDENGDCVDTGITTCWSDSFGESSFNTTRWNSGYDASEHSQSAGQLTTSLSGVSNGTLFQTGVHNFSGDFKLFVEFDSISLSSSAGYGWGLSATVGGTVYSINYRETTTESAGIYTYDGSWTQRTATSGDKGTTTFEISRVGSTITYKYNGTTQHTDTDSGAFTRVTLDMANVGSGAAGTPSCVVNYFDFEKPIGTPYCT
jgi:hypothetical protein